MNTTVHKYTFHSCKGIPMWVFLNIYLGRILIMCFLWLYVNVSLSHSHSLSLFLSSFSVCMCMYIYLCVYVGDFMYIWLRNGHSLASSLETLLYILWVFALSVLTHCNLKYMRIIRNAICCVCAISNTLCSIYKAVFKQMLTADLRF